MTTSLAHSAPPSIFDLEAYDYELPPEAIAQAPAARRDEARLLVLDRASNERRHLHVRDLAEILRAGDLLVLNDTRVVPARLRGLSDTGARVEALLLRANESGNWVAMAKPAKRLKPGRRITWFSSDGGEGAGRPTSASDGGVPSTFTATVVSSEGGQVELDFAGADLDEILRRCGELPLPPYIHRGPGPDAADRERYQTVYARNPGAIAAPTAGLHFTPELLDRLAERGVEQASLTLHVGPGTFQPVREGDVREHRMEPEWADIPETTAEAIARARREGRRVIAAGTTTTRALESRAVEGGVAAGAGWAGGFILPGHRFQVIDGLLTNFHLPKSTLLMLVSALVGREPILDLYRDAVARGYRFYSYGDATLIL